MTHELRAYQQQSLQDLRSAIARGVRAAVLMMTTGAGKTQVSAEIMAGAVRKGKRAWFVVDSKELLDQAADRFEAEGMSVGIIQGQNDRTDYGKPVQVATIQTLRNRWEQIAPSLRPNVIVIDECHVLHQAHEEIIAWAKDHKVPVIGLSATPWRKGLGQHFDELVVGATTQMLVEQGYLVPSTCYAPRIPDLGGVKTRGDGDWQEDALAEVMGDAALMGDIVSHWFKHARDRQTLVFATNVAHSRGLCDTFLKAGVKAAHIDGYERDPEVREQVINDFRAGKIQVLCNCAILCLDDQTEILTADGWKGIDDLADADAVANWHKDGGIDFRQPRRVFRRLKEPGERMVSMQTHGADFRVTEGHNMVVASGAGRKSWKDVPAIELEGKRFSWPKHGMAVPATIKPEMLDEKRQQARVRSLAYVYRQRGEAPDEARRVAEEHVAFKAQPAIPPAELSLDQCRFIGFWLADGTVSNGNKGGVIYSATQSKRYAGIIEWLDAVLDRAGIASTQYDKGDHVAWTFVRGTGGKGQRKTGGIYRLAAYLDKSGADRLWGLGRDQLVAVLEGFWYGDGAHGQVTFDQAEVRNHKITGTQRELYDLLQAICVCRGIAASVKPVARKAYWSDAWADQFTFSFTLDKLMGCNSRGRPAVETGIDNERVWCVETDSGYIVTRRNGVAMVMGNCKGFDAPETSCLILARPTKSLMLHYQMLGRGLRIAPGKEDCLILDHAGNCVRNGVPEDRVPATLDDGKNGRNLDRKQREPEEKVAKPCGSCGHVSTLHACPACGFAPERREDIEVKDGELYPITKREAPKWQPAEVRTLYAELLGHAQLKGYNPGWAYHKCREFAGTAPRDTKQIAPQHPSDKTLGQIKHLQIKQAKAKQKEAQA